jgi:putative ABC transport system ATP-binding protein
MPDNEKTDVIRLTGVHKTYQLGSQQVHALAGVDVRIGEGDMWAIMGPSGSGKSTLLNLIGCLDRPTQGTYHLCGQDVTDLDDDALSDVRLHELGFIFQSFNLIPQLTVRENIELPLYYLGLDATESASRAEATAELVGLSDRLEHRPMELSGGQQQRVAIARALVNEARVLLADEPTGNLDSVTGRQIMDMLHELNGKGKTIIMVTHDMEIAAETPLIMHIRDGIIDRIEERGR